MQLTPRQMKILSAVVELYIQTLEPVGSKAVCDMLDNACSSATVRNEMSTLCEKGLIVQPHTSAGRVPSQAGYRIYVDRLMGRYRLSAHDMEYIDSLIPRRFDSLEQLMEDAGRALSRLTDCASFSTTPASDSLVIKNIELFPVSQSKYLLVMLMEPGVLKNRLCRSEFSLSRDMLERFSNALSECYKGKSLGDINPASVQAAAVSLGSDMIPFLSVAENFLIAAKEASSARLMLGGQEHLFVKRELSHESAHRIFDAITRRDVLLGLLSGLSERVSILFGNETGQSDLDSAGIISSVYEVGGKTLGRIGIIGPVRMDYIHIIPSIEYFAKSLGNSLEDSVNNDDWS